MFKYFKSTAGIAMPIALVLGLAIFVAGFIINVNLHTGKIKQVEADTATTTVNVLNTPPNWDTNPYESPTSSTSTPTNVGNVLTFRAQATDPNTEDYFLLICSVSATATANPGAPPTCSGG